MNIPAKTPSPAVDSRREAERLSALAAAERSGIREGLPPVSDFARSRAAAYASGSISADAAVSEIVASHRARSGT